MEINICMLKYAMEEGAMGIGSSKFMLLVIMLLNGTSECVNWHQTIGMYISYMRNEDSKVMPQ